jgi:hypothetical protein
MQHLLEGGRTQPTRSSLHFLLSPSAPANNTLLCQKHTNRNSRVCVSHQHRERWLLPVTSGSWCEENHHITLNCLHPATCFKLFTWRVAKRWHTLLCVKTQRSNKFEIRACPAKFLERKPENNDSGTKTTSTTTRNRNKQLKPHENLLCLRRQVLKSTKSFGGGNDDEGSK